MKVPLIAVPYRVDSRLPGWKGWRLKTWFLGIADLCSCVGLAGDKCECAARGPHRHTGIVTIDRPLGLISAS